MNTSSIGQDKNVLESEGVKLLWDFSIQTEAKMDHNKSDILLLAKKRKSFHNRCGLSI